MPGVTIFRVTIIQLDSSIIVRLSTHTAHIHRELLSRVRAEYTDILSCLCTAHETFLGAHMLCFTLNAMTLRPGQITRCLAQFWNAEIAQILRR